MFAQRPSKSHKGFPRLLYACLLALVLASPCRGGILSTTGSLVEIAPPGSVLAGSLESDTISNIFAERAGVNLAAGLDINIDAPGTFTGILNPSATLAPGTVVDSYFVHMDPVGTRAPGTSYEGSVTFAQEILGIVTFRDKLDDSDATLGLASVDYPTDQDSFLRGVLDTNGTLDRVTLSADRRTVSFDLRVSSRNIEQMRILTAPSTNAVPEPATAAIFVGLIGAGMLRRRR